MVRRKGKFLLGTHPSKHRNQSVLSMTEINNASFERVRDKIRKIFGIDY